MGKKYVMFVDERGFFSTDVIINKFSMVGVIFEYDYCIDLNDSSCELKTKLNEYKKETFNNINFNDSLDDIVIKKKINKDLEGDQKKRVLEKLPSLLKNLKFNIIATSIRHDISNVKKAYSIAANNLLKNFYSFIKNKNGECGGVIMQARDYNASYMLQQSFFDIYNERSRNLSMLYDIQDKINTFIVSKKENSMYGLCIQVANIVDDIIFRVSNGSREINKKLTAYAEYDDTNVIFNAIKNKIYEDMPIEMGNRSVQKSSYNIDNNIEILNKELMKELNLKNIRIDEKEKKISELSKEIRMLNQQLQEVLTSRKSDKLVFQLLSDFDFTKKGIEKKAAIAKG